MGNENIYIRFDWAIKNILRDKANFDILEGFISVLTGEKVTIVELLESESNQENDKDKFNRVDIKAKNSRGEIIIVEVQLTRQLYYLERILYGTSKTITEHINLGENYDKVKKVYSISLLYCDYGKGGDNVYHGQTIFKGIRTGNDFLVNIKEENTVVPRHPREVFLEYYIVRVNEFDRIPENPLDEWMNYLKTGKIKEDTRTPGLQEVREKMRVLAMTPDQKKAYERHLENLSFRNLH